MSNEILLKKFDALDPQAQGQLIAFWDFLLAKAKKKTDATMSPSYRERIAQLSTWSEEDIAYLNESEQEWQWEPSKW